MFVRQISIMENKPQLLLPYYPNDKEQVNTLSPSLIYQTIKDFNASFSEDSFKGKDTFNLITSYFTLNVTEEIPDKSKILILLKSRRKGFNPNTKKILNQILLKEEDTFKSKQES